MVFLRTAGAALFFAALSAGDAWGQDGPPDPAIVYHAPTDPSELLKLDEPMRRYFSQHLPDRDDSEDQLNRLLDAILRPEGLHFAYDVEGTFDAREAFRRKGGNCVSFAFLVVAVAREYGFKASFQNVEIPERWNRFGNLIVWTKHINVRVAAGGNDYLVDLRPDLVANTDLQDTQVISDERAFAEFYGTAGFFELLHGSPTSALSYLTLATTIDPRFAGAWSNLAAVYLRGGNLPEARACYERALRADHQYTLAMDGYVDVLKQLGSPEDLQIAAKYERRARAIRERNPYYQQHLAELALKQGDWVAAEKLYRRAISLKRDEPQFFEEWVKVLLQLGRDDEARRASVKLGKLQERLAADPIHAVP